MPFDTAIAAGQLAAEVRDRPDPPDGGWPFGAPARELTRSPAAARVGVLAAEAGLGLFHAEWRQPLDLPEDWVPAHDPSLARAPTWAGGVQPERKYQSFRHDQAIGSYHPGMRAKWTAHELLHGLVGFAWHPGASPLFLATAGRLAELLPVVLWYFLDEAHLHRCEIHRHGGALYRRVCPECEVLAGPQIDELHAEAFLEAGRAYVERELLAIARTRRLGRPVPHVHGSLDLCSDGVAYAAAHGARLRSEVFHRFVDGFCVERGGMVTSLDALEARVVAVLDALTDGPAPPSLAPTRAHGEARWILQDVGWRLLCLAHETEGEAHEALLGFADGLASACDRTTDASASPDSVTAECRTAVAAAFAGYAALHDEWILPPPADVFAVGYDLAGLPVGRSRSNVEAGVRSAVPWVARLLDGALPGVVDGFLTQDHPVRAPIGRRFATWFAGVAPGPLAALARYESELSHLPPADPDVIGLGTATADGRYRLASGVRIVRLPIDVVELARGVDFGDWICDDLVLHDVDGGSVPEHPVCLALVRSLDGQPQVVDLEPAVADALMALREGAVPELPRDTLDGLCALGLLVPARWELDPPSW